MEFFYTYRNLFLAFYLLRPASKDELKDPKEMITGQIWDFKLVFWVV